MAVTYSFYHAAADYIHDAWDMSADSFKISLHVAETFLNTDTVWTDVSGTERGNNEGYTTTGQALTSVTSTQTSGVYKFDSADPSWTSTGTLEADDAVIYNDTRSDQLLCHIDFGTTETAANTTTFVISPDSTGWFGVDVT